MADKFKSIAKGGWHPGKDKEKNPYDYGKNEKPKHGIRENFKGVNTVASFVGKGKPVDDYDSGTHQSAPLSSLKDPSSFGAPPKRAGTSDFGGTYATPSPSSASPRKTNTTSSGGLGAPLGKQYGESIAERRERLAREEQEEAEAEAKRRAEPYKVNTTGLSTAGFAPPPKVRSDGFADHEARAPSAAKPSLPPRLPPRGSAGGVASPPPSYEQAEAQSAPDQGVLNQAALNRLGNAGVNVPALGVAAESPIAPPRHHVSSPPSSQTQGDQVNELQARFARMAGSDPTNAGSPSQGASLPTSPTKKKPAPPPPPKKSSLLSDATGEQAPPVPISSKPR